MRSYRIPNEVATELKISRGIYLFDFFLLMALLMIRSFTLPYVHSDFHVLYTIFLVGFAVFLIIRPKTNPKKRMYQAMYYALVRKKETYISTDYSEGER